MPSAAPGPGGARPRRGGARPEPPGRGGRRLRQDREPGPAHGGGHRGGPVRGRGDGRRHVHAEGGRRAARALPARPRAAARDRGGSRPAAAPGDRARAPRAPVRGNDPRLLRPPAPRAARRGRRRPRLHGAGRPRGRCPAARGVAPVLRAGASGGLAGVRRAPRRRPRAEGPGRRVRDRVPLPRGRVSARRRADARPRARPARPRAVLAAARAAPAAAASTGHHVRGPAARPRAPRPAPGRRPRAPGRAGRAAGPLGRAAAAGPEMVARSRRGCQTAGRRLLRRRGRALPGAWRHYCYRVARCASWTGGRAHAAEVRRRAITLSYEDLLQIAARLLRERPDVRGALQQKYRWLFVDEFQDTDPIQAEVICLLAAEPRRAPAARLDARPAPARRAVRRRRSQAVDLPVPPRRHRDLRPRAGPHRGDRRQHGVRSPRPSAPRPALCDWANTVFPRLFPRRATPQQPAFESLDAVREPGDGRRVGVRQLVVPDTVAKRDVAAADADAIARVIRAEVDAGRRGFGDFLVLTCRKKALAGYARGARGRSRSRSRSAAPPASPSRAPSGSSADPAVRAERPRRRARARGRPPRAALRS